MAILNTWTSSTPALGPSSSTASALTTTLCSRSGAVRPRDKRPSKQFKRGHTPLSVAEDIPWSKRQLVVGSGHSGSLPVMSEVHDEAKRRGVELVVLPTAEACALLRGLDPADVNAILHVTC